MHTFALLNFDLSDVYIFWKVSIYQSIQKADLRTNDLLMVDVAISVKLALAKSIHTGLWWEAMHVTTLALSHEDTEPHSHSVFYI